MPSKAREPTPESLPIGIGRGNPFYDRIKRAERGTKLADFDLFALIEFVWTFTNHPPKSTGNRQLDAELQKDWALPEHQAALGEQLASSLAKGDYVTLGKVADSVEWLQAGAADRLDLALLIYFRTNDSRPSRTIEKITECVVKRMGWEIGQKGRTLASCDKKLRRRCHSLGLAITPSRPGPKLGSKHKIKTR